MKIDFSEIIDLHYRKICLLPIVAAILVLMEWGVDYSTKIGDYYLRTIVSIGLVIAVIVANSKENQINDMIAALRRQDSVSAPITYQGDEPVKKVAK